jgi:lipoprotein-anchoring transpeptidase ErfK/SrfK
MKRSSFAAFAAALLVSHAVPVSAEDAIPKAASERPPAPAAPMLTVAPPSISPPQSTEPPPTIPGSASGLPSIPPPPFKPPSQKRTPNSAAPASIPPASAPTTKGDIAAAKPSPTLDIVNNAKFGDNGEKGGISPSIIRAEVMLDRVHASPGVIDGRDGENFRHALATYESVKGLKATSALDQQAWSALTAESGTPVLIEYVLTEDDVRGPFYPDLPTDYAKLATLPMIGYRSPSQKIGAKFHMGEALLAALNPAIDLTKAGSKILVTDIKPTPIRDKISSIVVDKQKGQVLGFNGSGTLLVAYPATIGSQELPSPSGTYKVRGVAYNPIYYYDPKNFLQGNNKGKLKLPPGPNNPVGSVFIALTKPTYGLHGTPDPSKIDKTASHGCVRMTNWDANELAHLVKRGVVVQFKE